MPNAFARAVVTPLPDLSNLSLPELVFIFEATTTAALVLSATQAEPRCTDEVSSLIERHVDALWRLAGEARDIVRHIRPRSSDEAELVARVLLANAVHTGEWSDATYAVAMLKARA